MEQEQQKQKPSLKNTTIVLMISTALFFDILQWLLEFLFMGWLITIFAHLTFFVWLKTKGVSYINFKASRIVTLLVGTILDLIPVVGFCAWTVMILKITSEYKVKKLVPESAIISKVAK